MIVPIISRFLFVRHLATICVMLFETLKKLDSVNYVLKQYLTSILVFCWSVELFPDFWGVLAAGWALGISFWYRLLLNLSTAFLKEHSSAWKSQGLLSTSEIFYRTLIIARFKNHVTNFTVSKSPVVVQTMPHFGIDGRHCLHIGFSPLATQIFSLHL